MQPSALSLCRGRVSAQLSLTPLPSFFALDARVQIADKQASVSRARTCEATENNRGGTRENHSMLRPTLTCLSFLIFCVLALLLCSAPLSFGALFPRM